MPTRSDKAGKHRLVLKTFRCSNACCPGILLNKDRGWALIYEERNGKGGVKFNKKQLRALAAFLIEQGYAKRASE